MPLTLEEIIADIKKGIDFAKTMGEPIILDEADRRNYSPHITRFVDEEQLSFLFVIDIMELEKYRDTP